jgi:PAS domain S-box-containing protein
MSQIRQSRIVWPPTSTIVLFGITFLLAYRFGIAFTQDFAAPFWFPDAILLSTLLLTSSNEWWLYVLVTLPIRLFLFVPQGTPLWFLFACFANDALKALLSAWLLRHASRDRSWFDNLHQFGRYFGATVVLMPALSAATGAAARSVLGSVFWTTWERWFLADALASLVLTPFILVTLNYKRFLLSNLVRYVKASLIAAGLMLGGLLAFEYRPRGAGYPPFMLYLPVPFLLWATMDFGPIGASSSLLLMSVLAILVTLVGRGPFQSQSPEDSLLSMQLFLFLASVPFMFLSVITFQKQKRAAELRDSEEHFRSLIDAAPVMLWMSGPDARCTFFNEPWLDFIGLSQKEQLEQDWVARVHPEDRERCVNQYLAAVKSRENFTLDYRLLGKDGAYRWLLHNGVPRYGADGAFLGYIGTRLDVTDRRDAEEQLRAVSAQVINAQETERYHIGQELHDDLAQRITALSFRLTGLSQKLNGSAHLAADFDDLQQQAGAICRDILQFSYQLRPATVECLGLPTALRDLCRQATNHGRVVVFAQDENLPQLPKDVSVPLHRIAQEAVRNAMAHSGATYIHVELSASPTTVRLSVKDNGCGFVVGSIAKHGLGLSGMSHRMRNSGGRFNITSRPGRGTSITATMPLIQSMKAASRS